jgi:hypothetical protein
MCASAWDAQSQPAGHLAHLVRDLYIQIVMRERQAAVPMVASVHMTRACVESELWRTSCFAFSTICCLNFALSKSLPRISSYDGQYAARRGMAHPIGGSSARCGLTC